MKRVLLKIILYICIILHYTILIPISYFGTLVCCICFFPVPLLVPIMLCFQEWNKMGVNIIILVVASVFIAIMCSLYYTKYTSCSYGDLWFNIIKTRI